MKHEGRSPGGYRLLRTSRAPRTSRMARSLRKRINRRAAQLARDAYARFRDELQAAIAEHPALIDQIDRWRPFDQRG